MRGLRYAAGAVILLALLLVGVIAFCYKTIPVSDTAATHFDAIIVLGVPANPDGSPSPEQRSRVLEGIREFRAGVAPRIIMTGGPAHNRFVEAHTMAEFAEAQGIPADALIEEGQAQNTIQNIFYSKALMDRAGWKSAEVVSSPSHLPRAGLILEHYHFAWRTHPAPWPPEFQEAHIYGLWSAEAVYCTRLRLLGFKASRFLPLQ